MTGWLFCLIEVYERPLNGSDLFPNVRGTKFYLIINTSNSFKNSSVELSTS